MIDHYINGWWSSETMNDTGITYHFEAPILTIIRGDNEFIGRIWRHDSPVSTTILSRKTISRIMSGLSITDH